MKKLLLFSLCFTFLSCITTKQNEYPYLSVYKRVSNNTPNVLKTFYIFKQSPQKYELHIHNFGGRLGTYTIANDTLMLFNKYEYSCYHGKMVITEIDSTDYFSLYPITFLIKKDSLIDITCYPNPVADFDIDIPTEGFRSNYVLEKKNNPIKNDY